jgi:hypothetical protein
MQLQKLYRRVLRFFLRRHPWITLTSLLLLCGVAVEMLARCRETPANFPEAIEFQYSADTLWELKPTFSFERDMGAGMVAYQTNAMGFRARELQAQPVRRVMCAGDSTTWGYGVPFDTMYPELLNQRFGDAVEVFSTGVPGFSLFQCRKQIESKLVGLQPDIITLSSNFNERRYVLDSVHFEDPGQLPHVYRKRVLVEFVCRFSKAFQHGLQGVQALREAYSKKNIPRLDGLRCRVSLSRYREEAERICQLCQTHGIKLILIGKGDSFQNFEKIYQYSQAVNPREQARYLMEARKNSPSGVFGVATVLLLRLLERHPEIDVEIDPEQIASQYHYYWSLHGGFIIEPDWGYRAVLREVAEKYSVPYLDFYDYTHAIDEVASGEESLFIYDDPTHLNKTGHAWMAEALAPLLAGALSE